MSLINRFKRELFLKIVYVGPRNAGKSENLRQIYDSMDDKDPSGFLVHRDSTGEAEAQTLFFDFLPLTLGQVVDFNVRLHLFSLPGSGKYDAITKMMLRGVDGIVCVLPSLPDRIEDNAEALKSTKDLLESFGKSFGEIPMVFQYSYQDSKRALPIETMRELYNPQGFPEFLSKVNQGIGVLETLRGITHETVQFFKTNSNSTIDAN